MVRSARVGVRRAAGGPRDGFLRGDEEEVRSRRRACMGTRAAAVQGALNLAAGHCAPSQSYGIDRARLEEEVARSAAHGASLALKTAKKVESDARAWDEYVRDMSIVVCNYPTVEQVVGFGAWLSRRRQRACLAQRSDEVPVLTGVQRRTARNMISELIKHHPEGRRLLTQYGAKPLAMQVLKHPDPTVQKYALTCVQRLMVINWEYLNRS